MNSKEAKAEIQRLINLAGKNDIFVGFFFSREEDQYIGTASDNIDDLDYMIIVRAILKKVKIDRKIIKEMLEDLFDGKDL